MSLARSRSAPELAAPPQPVQAGPEVADFGSNAELAAAIPRVSAAPTGGGLLDQAAAEVPPVNLQGNARRGSRGDDVKALQSHLGIPSDGVFGRDTHAAVRRFQRAHGLVADGIVGKNTRIAMAKPIPRAVPVSRPVAPARVAPAQVAPAQVAPAVAPVEVAQADTAPAVVAPAPAVAAAPAVAPAAGPIPKGLRSPHHDDARFAPKYPATAYSESSIYRTKEDPYAVGAITRPTREQDLGGKTYGTYQFDSRVYRDGSDGGKGAVAGSTVSRFARSEGNPYKAELEEVIRKDGVASAAFDAKWRELTGRENKGFGEAQQKFMEAELKAKVDRWFDSAGVTGEARKDPRLFDVVVGTLNQYGTLSDGMAKGVAPKKGEGPKTADEVGTELQNDKWGSVGSNFKSSPKAHDGIYARINREGAMFDGYDAKKRP